MIGTTDLTLILFLDSGNFRADEDEGYSHLFKQPENDEEEALCRDAMESCPVEAIGDDGDES